MKACLIGKTLKHSFSKEIHEKLGVAYDLCEVAEGGLEDFVKSGQYTQFNVTIPYKETIIPFLDELDDTARAVGCVNTVYVKEGKRIGYNTDIEGMAYLFRRSGVSLSGKNVVVLGTGGTSKTAQALLRREEAKKVTLVGRKERWNYENYGELTDTQIVINTTPVGMYPDVERCSVEIERFPCLEFVADVIYNPLKTQLLLSAEKRGIPHANGLSMLVHQAVCAELIWGNGKVMGQTEHLLSEIKDRFTNIVLVGMPSCGKTTVGRILAKKCRKTFIDMDEEIEALAGIPISEIFAKFGEEYFRDLEAQVAKKVSLKNGCVISTGGGTPVREENRDALKKNGFVVWIRRDLSLLSKENRPVSQKNDLSELYEKRKEFYDMAADVVVDNDKTAEISAEEIKEIYEKDIGN